MADIIDTAAEIEVVNRKASYVATAMTGMRRLRALPGQAS